MRCFYFPDKRNLSNGLYTSSYMDLETSCHKRKIFEKEARWVIMKCIKRENRKRAKNEGKYEDRILYTTSASYKCKYLL